VAAAYDPRIHARASGASCEGDFESLFSRDRLPGISGTFDGDIDTKTKSTRLDVQSVTTDSSGTRTQQTRAEFPRKLALGAALRPAPTWQVAADYESTRGRYGRSEIDLQVLRLGAEHTRGAWQWRGGAMVPVKIQSSMTGTLKAPFHFSPTLGLGWRQGPAKVDLALYAHAVMSMNRDRAHPAADLGLSLAF